MTHTSAVLPPVMYVPVFLSTCVLCDTWHVNVYGTAAGCGMSSNVYTDHVLMVDTLEGKPSDVDLCRASPDDNSGLCIWLKFHADRRALQWPGSQELLFFYVKINVIFKLKE